MNGRNEKKEVGFDFVDYERDGTMTNNFDDYLRRRPRKEVVFAKIGGWCYLAGNSWVNVFFLFVRPLHSLMGSFILSYKLNGSIELQNSE